MKKHNLINLTSPTKNSKKVILNYAFKKVDKQEKKINPIVLNIPFADYYLFIYKLLTVKLNSIKIGIKI